MKTFTAEKLSTILYVDKGRKDMARRLGDNKPYELRDFLSQLFNSRLSVPMTRKLSVMIGEMIEEIESEGDFQVNDEEYSLILQMLEGVVVPSKWLYDMACELIDSVGLEPEK